MITQKVDKIAQELEQNVGEKQENGAAAKENTFYSSVASVSYTHLIHGRAMARYRRAGNRA